MNKFGYQLFDVETGWTGYYIWTEKAIAEAMCNEMNKDRDECNLPMTISIRTVEIINSPF